MPVATSFLSCDATRYDQVAWQVEVLHRWWWKGLVSPWLLAAAKAASWEGANRGTFGDAKPNVLSEMYLNAWVVSTQKAKKEFNNIKPRSKYGHKNPYKSRKAQNPVSSSGLSARHPGTAPRLQQIYAESRTPCAPLKSEARVTASPVRLRTSLGESHSCKPMASGFLQSP